MSCGSCVKKLEGALTALPWPIVKDVHVNLLAESASLTLGGVAEGEFAKAVDVIIEAVALRGLTANLTNVSSKEVASDTKFLLEVNGMSCSSCASSVQRALSNVDKVKEVQVNLLAETASVSYPGALSPRSKATMAETLCAAVNDAGYDAKFTEAENEVEEVNVEMAIEVGASEEDGLQVSGAMQFLRQLPEITSVVTSERGLRITLLAKRGERARLLRETLWSLQDRGFGARFEAANLRKASPLQRAQARQVEEAQTWRRSFFRALLLSAPIVVIMWFLYPLPALQPYLMPGSVDVGGILMAALATPVQFGSGWVFYRETWAGLKHGKVGMAAMVSIGTSAAYVTSCVQLLVKLLQGEMAAMDLDFDTSALLITFVLLGKWLECRAKGSTGDAITALMALQPQSALLLEQKSGNLQERQVDVHMLLTGDLVKVLPGAKVPADGVVEFGRSAVDESALTGESVPIAKGPGDRVIGGTANHGGVLQVRLDAVGEASALSQIASLVEQAQSQKAPVQEFADRISGFFVPVVMILSATTLILWLSLFGFGVVKPEHLPKSGASSPWSFSIMTAVSVLVVACPCALGLAAPTAVMVGTGVGAKQGILIKGGRALETAHHVQVMVLDKTGTITEGRPAVTDIDLLSSSVSERQLEDVRQHLLAVGCLQKSSEEFGLLFLVLFLGACAERSSEHPLAQAVVKEAERLLAKSAASTPGHFLREAEDFQATPGSGIEATVLGHKVHVGNLQFMQSCGVDISAASSSHQALEDNGKTVVFVSVDGSLSLSIAMADVVKSESATAIQSLQAMGRDVYMLTGDNERTAAAVARQVGIPADNVVASVLPSGKAEKVRELQGNLDMFETADSSRNLARSSVCRIVAMVGDGVNDAPALAQADVGIAIGAGAEIAMEAADMVLVRSRLSDVVVALHLSTAIFRRIQLNFLFSLGYNTAGIPLAAGLFFAMTGQPLAPFISGAAMALSSVSVVTSSLMLRRYRPPQLPICSSRRVERPAAELLQDLQAEKAARAEGQLYLRGRMESCSTTWGSKICACDPCLCKRCAETAQ
eukprot:TRINITY_DN25873_c0_g1_i1.p1 TRINITY_DN25873_c0_g1~~TRINITY_DN25873_c0_g1_i1.p1  ORF type:complete len:1096 (-),score=269.60 TRINITY_DN25873_c0_g1_i1:5-3172(-)